MAEQLPKPPSLVDLQKMESDITHNESPAAAAPPEKVSPTKHREPTNSSTITSFSSQTPLQSIATNLKRLIWDDAERMATLVEKYYKADGANMARAIQQAADEVLQDSTSA